jgi:hypothetical protein
VRLRILWLRLRLLLLYRWRRGSLSARVPESVEPDPHAELPPPIDTGGVRRPPFGSQFGDPSETHTGSHSEGSNCTMAAAGMALDYQTDGRVPWRGGTCRHHQSDLEGGTDLYDAAEAFAGAGESLSIRSGRGWSGVVDALEERRGVILQGTGGLPGCGDYTGGHAIYVQPEANGSRWLKGDPECSGYEWAEASTLRAWAERLSSSVYYAVTSSKGSGSTTPPPSPVPPPCPPCPPESPRGPELRLVEGYAANLALDGSVADWVAYLGPPGPLLGGAWDGSTWAGDELASVALLLDDCDEFLAVWGRGSVPDPAAAARHAIDHPATWGSEGWRELLWR